MAASSPSLLNEEYETQFFGFPPSSVMLGVRNLVMTRFGEALDHLEENLGKLPSKALPKDELERGITILRQHTDDQVNKKLQELEDRVVGTVMKVPPYLLLPSDLEHATSYSKTEISTLEQELVDLQRQLTNEKYVQAKLEEELHMATTVIEQQKEFLSSTLNKKCMTKINETKEKLKFLSNNVEEINEINKSISDYNSNITDSKNTITDDEYSGSSISTAEKMLSNMLMN